MNFKKAILLHAILCLYVNLNAQDTIPNLKNSHIIGVQANQLVRQILNLSNTNLDAGNPYLLTYSIIGKKNKLGLDIGAGYIYSNILDNDGFTKRQTYANLLAARIGILKQIPLAKRFSAQAKFHLVFDSEDGKTTTVTEQFVKQTTVIKSNIMRYGAGPAFTLQYAINKRMLVGTEMNYYFKTGKNKFEATTIQDTGGSTTTIKNDSESDLTLFKLNLPAVLFLNLKL